MDFLTETYEYCRGTIHLISVGMFLSGLLVFFAAGFGVSDMNPADHFFASLVLYGTVFAMNILQKLSKTVFGKS